MKTRECTASRLGPHASLGVADWERSGAHQPGQPLPGIRNLGQAGARILPVQTLIKANRYHFPMPTKLPFFD
jgi:hypothetical protein